MSVSSSPGFARPSDADAPEGTGGVILHVEDSAPLRFARRRALEHVGFRVIDAPSVAEAWDAVLQLRPDVVLTDIKLPDGDGYELTRRIKNHVALATTRVVQVSALFVDAASRVRGLDSGADAYIIEPTEPAELVAVMRAMVRGRRAEELFSTLLEGSPMLVVGVDAHGEIAVFNAACETLTGYPRADVIGRPFVETLVTPDDREVVARRFANASSVELAMPHENAWRTAAGDDVDIEWRCFRVVGPAGTAWTLGIGVDVTSRNRADAALRESQERLSLALDSARMGMWELNLTTGACTWSPQTALLFGLPLGTSAGSLEKLLELVHPDDREHVLESVKAASDGAAFDVEFRTTWPDGSTHWIRGTGHMTRTSDGQHQRLIGIGQDTTQRQLSNRLLQTIIDSTSAVVYVVDAANRFHLINRRFGELFGILPAEAIGASIFDHFPPDVADQFAANNQRVLEAGTVLEFEEVVPQADGTRTYVSVKAPLLDVDGRVYAVCGVSTDITEHKRLLAALGEANRQKDTFLATVAHELRQPLGAIQAALGVMRLRGGREVGERARQTVERQVTQLTRLVEDLLDAARVVRGKASLKRQRVRLNEVLDAATAVVQPLVVDRGQQLEVDLPAEAIWLDADAARLQQVFSNLLTNAVKFTPRAGQIRLGAEVDGDRVTVRVRDTGRGIPPEMLPRIFELFTQEQSDSGLGIGLAVVRGIVEQHGGTVEAHSEGRGSGSEFVVRLPANAAGAQAPA